MKHKKQVEVQVVPEMPKRYDVIIVGVDYDEGNVDSYRKTEVRASGRAAILRNASGKAIGKPVESRAVAVFATGDIEFDITCAMQYAGMIAAFPMRSSSVDHILYDLEVQEEGKSNDV